MLMKKHLISLDISSFRDGRILRIAENTSRFPLRHLIGGLAKGVL